CPIAPAATSGSQAPSAGEKYPVPDASPRSVTGSLSSRGPASSSQVRKSCGSITRYTRAAWPGSCSASQRSLVPVNHAFRPVPGRSADHRGPRAATSAAAARADRRSFQSSAGRITAAFSSRTTMPCCWPAIPMASARESSSSPACCSAYRQASGSTSVPPGCGALAWPTMVPSSASHSSTLVDCVEESTPATSIPTDFSTVIAHRADTRLLGAGAFEDHVVVYLRRDGLTGLRLLRTDGSKQEVAFPEPLYQVSPGSNPEYASRQFRLHYASLATPDSVFDADTRTG